MSTCGCFLEGALSQRQIHNHIQCEAWYNQRWPKSSPGGPKLWLVVVRAVIKGAFPTRWKEGRWADKSPDFKKSTSEKNLALQMEKQVSVLSLCKGLETNTYRNLKFNY